MKCPECFSQEGSYHEVEDYDSEWVLWTYTYWQCLRCDNTVYSYEDGFVWDE